MNFSNLAVVGFHHGQGVVLDGRHHVRVVVVVVVVGVVVVGRGVHTGLDEVGFHQVEGATVTTGDLQHQKQFSGVSLM